MAERPASRDTPPSAASPLRFGDCRFDPGSGLLWREGREIALPPRPLRLLEAFLERPGRTLGRTQLLDSVWEGEIVEEDALTQAVSVLRTALGDDRRDPRYIQTLHGRGYRFIAELEPAEPAQDDSRPGQRPGPQPRRTPAATIRRSSPGSRLLLALAVVVLIAAAAWALVGESATAPSDAVPLRYALALPAGFRPAEFSPGSVALSPDGRTVALVGYGEDGSHILVKGPGDYGLRVLSGTEQGYAPFFAPAGDRIAFFRGPDAGLAVVELASGASRFLTPVADPPHRGAWAADGHLYFSEGRRGLLRVAETGGEAEVVLRPSEAAGETRFLDVQTAGARRLLITVGTREMTSWNEARVQSFDLDTGKVRTLVDGGLSPHLLGDTLLYGRRGRLLAGRIGGDGRLHDVGAVIDDLSTFGLVGAAQFAVANGALAFLGGGERDVRTEVSLVDGHGTRQRLPLHPGTYLSVDADESGRRLALWTAGDFGHVWTYDLDRQTLTRQTRDWQNMAPLWRPSSDQIVYTSVRGGAYELRLKSVAETGPGATILEADVRILAGSWSPDGSQLVYVRHGKDGESGIRLLDLDTGSDRLLVAGRYDESAPALSPDGQWLAYTSAENGERQVYLTRPGAPSTRLQVSAHGGGRPRWSADGRHILYVSGGGLMRVRLDLAGTRRLGAAETVLDGPLLPGFDILPDGGFLVIEELEPPPPATELRIRRLAVDTVW